jgi:hypothetical protein
MSAHLLWRKVLKATIDTLEGHSRGQYHIGLPRIAGIQGFFGGLPQTGQTAKGGFDVVVPLEAAPAPLSVPPATIVVSYIGSGSERADWRIRSQRPETAYPLWRPGVGLRPGTPSGRDFVVIVRDPAGRFHARWLYGAQLARLPFAFAERMRSRRTAGIEQLDPAAWGALAKLLTLPGAASPTAVAAAAPPLPPPPAPAEIGQAYRPEDEATVTARREPFAVDPDRVDRGTRAHRRTQNLLAAHLGRVGLTPISPVPGRDLPFDVAWREGDLLVVAEVKSLTHRNEERQLRLGLGQVLRYAHLLRGQRGCEVQPALVVEREPSDPTWGELCAALGVRLAWPAVFAGLTADA